MTQAVSERLLKLSLLALSAYFTLIALAHITSTKVPLLFVYFNVPSHAYQDNIISFLAFGWAVFIFSAARNPLASLGTIRALIIAAIGAVAGLSYTNATTDFDQLAPGIAVWPFWAQTAAIGVIGLWILVLYRSAKK